MNKKKILLLGAGGKMGLALQDVLRGRHEVTGLSSKDFDASDPQSVRALFSGSRPDIVINTVACLGIDPCEQAPQRAFQLNALYPKLLAELAEAGGFVLAHFSTDAVFNDAKKDYYLEEDAPAPLNLYGLTKHGGDCLIAAAAPRHYIFRISLLFGETTRDAQFVEKMLGRIRAGQKVLRVSDDIVCSPSYSRDIARAVQDVLESLPPFGLYHVANAGMASLCEFMREIVRGLDLPAVVEKASHKDFPHIGRKNTFTPLRSAKIAPLRPWQEAVQDYCARARAIPEA